MKLALTATPTDAPSVPCLVRGTPPGDAFALAAELGYDGVELHLRRASDVNAAEILALMSSHGLAVPALGTGQAAGLDGLTFSSPDSGIRRRAVERVGEHVELAARLRSAVIVGSLSGRLGSEPQQRPVLRAAALECLAECCRLAARAGVTVLLEPLNRYECDYINSVRDALDVIEQIGAPNLRVLADTFHMNIEEADVPAAVNLAAGRLGHVHLADSNRRAAGHGHLDMRAVVEALRGIGYREFVSFEVFPFPDARRAAEDAARTVRDHLCRV